MSRGYGGGVTIGAHAISVHMIPIASHPHVLQPSRDLNRSPIWYVTSPYVQFRWGTENVTSKYDFVDKVIEYIIIVQMVFFFIVTFHHTWFFINF